MCDIERGVTHIASAAAFFYLVSHFGDCPVYGQRLAAHADIARFVATHDHFDFKRTRNKRLQMVQTSVFSENIESFKNKISRHAGDKIKRLFNNRVKVQSRLCKLVQLQANGNLRCRGAFGAENKDLAFGMTALENIRRDNCAVIAAAELPISSF